MFFLALINRPGVAGAVLPTPLSLINLVSQTTLIIEKKEEKRGLGLFSERNICLGFRISC